MIRKRRSLSSRATPKEVPSVSRARSLRAPERHRRGKEGSDDHETLPLASQPTTQEMKQELIWAHAKARREQGVKPHARFWVTSVVIAVACLALVSWWVALGTNIQEATQDQDALFDQVFERSQALKETVGGPPVQVLQPVPANQATSTSLSVTSTTQN